MRRSLLPLCLGLSILACDGETPAEPGVCDASLEGVSVGPDCAVAATVLRPAARVDGAWVRPDGPCTAEGEGLRCPSAAGALLLERDGARLRAGLEPDAPVTVEALVLEGPLALEGATGWISNGFHSWSQSGVIALGTLPDDGALLEAIGARGDTEVLRTGTELSWEYTLAGGGETAMLAGAVGSARWRPWVQVGHAAAEDGDDEEPARGLTLRLGSGGIERVAAAAGEPLFGEPFRVAFGAPEALMAEHAAALPAYDSSAEAEAGWNSWYELWDTVDEEAVRANAARAEALLGPRVDEPLRIVVDDGWQRAWGDWAPNEKFPSGLDGLAADLSADGFRMGVWLAPLLAAEDSDLATEHPGWLVGGATYQHAKHGTMRVLDVTNPEVEAHLRETVARIVGWGYDLLKIDFLFAGSFEGERTEDVTGMEAYHRALSILRDAAGDDALLLTVGAPGLASLPYSDSWRVGGDIALEPFGAGWAWLPNQARSLAARYPYCLRVLCDADPPILRDLPRAEVEAGAWIVAFSGGALFLSDDLRDLEDERADWALTEPRVEAALSGAPAWPEDPFGVDPPRRLSNAIGDHLSRGGASTHVVPRVWRLPDGRRVVLNATESPVTVEGTEVPARGTVVLP